MLRAVIPAQAGIHIFDKETMDSCLPDRPDYCFGNDRRNYSMLGVRAVAFWVVSPASEVRRALQLAFFGEHLS